MKKLLKKENGGFSLIEIMVSVSVFALVMLYVSSSIYTVFNSNKKSQSMRSVMDNLNFSLESMTRTIRFGTKYHCNVSSGVVSDPLDCPSGANSISVLDSSGAQVNFRLSGGRIEQSFNGGTYQQITGLDVNISTLTFYVLGSTPYSSGSNLLQPRVIIVVRGSAGSSNKPTTQSSFNLQTTISQRMFDSQ